MFSLEKFYDILYKNLLDPFDTGYFYFSKFGSLAPEHFSKGIAEFKADKCVLFYDQEPIYQSDLDMLEISSNHNERLAYFNNLLSDNSIIDKFLVFANSEISEEKNKFLENNPSLHDWYYFFH